MPGDKQESEHTPDSQKFETIVCRRCTGRTKSRLRCLLSENWWNWYVRSIANGSSQAHYWRKSGKQRRMLHRNHSPPLSELISRTSWRTTRYRSHYSATVCSLQFVAVRRQSIKKQSLWNSEPTSARSTLARMALSSGDFKLHFDTSSIMPRQLVIELHELELVYV